MGPNEGSVAMDSVEQWLCTLYSILLLTVSKYKGFGQNRVPVRQDEGAGDQHPSQAPVLG